MKKLYIFILIVISNSIYSQKKDIEVPVTVASPSAFQFNKISSIFDNNSTGAFSYSYSLGDISIDNVTIPLSLNYYTTGLKVDELAGYTGTNWNLSYGGIITRTVKGVPDELAMERWHPNQLNLLSDIDFNKILDISQQPRTGIYDSEKDLFSFNVNGKSGMFYLPVGNYSDTLIINDIISEEKYNIIFNQNTNGLSEFKILTTEGIEYIFGGDTNFIELNISDSDCRQTHPIKPKAITSWYLKSIKTLNGKFINFSYNNHNYDYVVATDETIGFTEKSICPDNLNTNSQIDYNPFYKFCLNYSSLTSKYISTIKTDNQTIKFNYSDNRNDETKYELINIEFLNNYTNSKISTVDLVYDYININKNHNHFRLIGNPNLARRIFLKEIIKGDSVGSKIQSTKFEYNNLNDLPIRLSFAQDKFGYYNGNTNNKNLFPNKTNYNNHINQLITTNGFNHYFENNLEPNDKVYNGILNKIIHPTGGETIVNYEPNTTQEKVYSTSQEQEYFDFIKECGEYDTNSFREFEFISNGSPISFTANVSPISCDPDGTIPNDTLHNEYSIQVINITTNQIIFNISPSYNVLFNNNSAGNCISSNGYPITGYITNPICTVNGNKYKVKFSIKGKPFVGARGTFNLFYNKKELSSYVNKRGPGVRVKSIFNKDGDSVYNKIEYYYNTFENFKNSINQTSANLTNKGVNFKEYYTKTDAFFDCKCNEELGFDLETCDQATRSETDRRKKYYEITAGTNQSYFNNIKGDVFYSNLLEIHSNKNEQFYIQKDYLIIDDTEGIVVNGEKTSFAPKSNLSLIANGKIKSHYYYNDSDIVKKTNLDYGNLNFNDVKNYQMIKYYDIPSFSPIDRYNRLNNISIYEYRTYSGITVPTKNITTEYFENSTTPVTTEINYNYDSPNHLQVTKQTTTNSKGETITTEYQYPPDLVGRRPFADILTAQNRIAEPMITTTRNGEQVISSVYTEYNDFNGIIQKSRVFQKKGSSSIVEGDDVIAYNSYDAFGNITQYTPKNGSSVSIIWGYNGKYPVAKIEGDTYANSITKIGSLLTKLQNGTLTPIEENSIRGLFPDAMITTYKYKPLIGVTSITGPNGLTEIYEYDSAGRLEVIRNHKNEILKTFKYNYKN